MLTHTSPALTFASSDSEGQCQSRQQPQIQLWKITEGVFVVTEQNAADVTISASSAELIQMIMACPDLLERVNRSTSSAVTPALEQVASWTALTRGLFSARIRQLVAGATLLLIKTSFLEVAGWSEMEGLRRLGIVRLMIQHPYREDGSVLSVAMSCASGWREVMDLLVLSRYSVGRRVLKRAWPERGLMWIAGPAKALPADEKEMSERFALFEGTRQLPPLPVSHASIRRSGNGRYSIWGRHVFLSSIHEGRRPSAIWMVPNKPATQRRLKFVSEIITPLRSVSRRPFLEELEATIAADDPACRAPELRIGDRIVVLTHALPPGGAERQWCYLAGELQKMGYDVHFVTLSPLEGQNQHYLPLLTSEGVKVTPLDQKLQRGELLDALRSTLDHINSDGLVAGMGNPFGHDLLALTNLFKRLKPRAVFAQLDHSNLMAGAAGVLAKVPQIVLSFRNYNPTRFSYLTNDWYQPLYATLARSPRVLLTGNSRASNADYAQWIGVTDSRVKLVPNALDARNIGRRDPASLHFLRQHLEVSSETPLVLGVFRLSEEKRPLLFIQTIAQIAAAVPDVRAFVVGIGPFEEPMQRCIDDLGLRRAVTLLGRRDDVLELMQISSLLLLTSSFEGMPNVVMEAQAMSLPVVASNVGGVPDCMIDGETGFLVDVNDTPSFARKCVELLTDDGLRNRLGARGATYMRNSFSRRAMAERYLRVLLNETEASLRKPVTLRAAAA